MYRRADEVHILKSNGMVRMTDGEDELQCMLVGTLSNLVSRDTQGGSKLKDTRKIIGICTAWQATEVAGDVGIILHFKKTEQVNCTQNIRFFCMTRCRWLVWTSISVESSAEQTKNCP